MQAIDVEESEAFCLDIPSSDVEGIEEGPTGDPHRTGAGVGKQPQTIPCTGSIALSLFRRTSSGFDLLLILSCWMLFESVSVMLLHLAELAVCLLM
jgi:hypothetical protein